MIYVDRVQFDSDANEIKPPKGWFERAEKEAKIALKEKKNHVAKASIYGHADVKAALEELFKHKCAYCECDLDASFDWDVEHFRPKSAVAERADHPGYYWLAYDWNNLFPSCSHCNQRRFDKPTWHDKRRLPSKGKAAQFPLVNEKTRAICPADEERKEHTLLIDPTYDDPVFYLGYDPMGNIFALDDNKYGEATIDVFHLDRRRLVQARRGLLKQIKSCIDIIENLDINISDKRDAKEDLLKLYADSDKKFSGMVRAYADMLGVSLCKAVSK